MKGVKMSEVTIQKLYLNLTGMTESTAQKEADSSFKAPEGCHIVARLHNGDENGSTKCKYARFELPLEAEQLGFGEVVYGDRRTVTVKESSSKVKGEDGEIIIKRVHTGDENGNTQYTFAQVFVRINGTRILVPCKTGASTEVTVKESSGNYAESKDKSMVLRNHKGDENADSTYGFSKMYIEYTTK